MAKTPLSAPMVVKPLPPEPSLRSSVDITLITANVFIQISAQAFCRGMLHLRNMQRPRLSVVAPILLAVFLFALDAFSKGPSEVALMFKEVKTALFDLT